MNYGIDPDELPTPDEFSQSLYNLNVYVQLSPEQAKEFAEGKRVMYFDDPEGYHKICIYVGDAIDPVAHENMLMQLRNRRS